jgi:hypothetical protein
METFEYELIIDMSNVDVSSGGSGKGIRLVYGSYIAPQRSWNVCNACQRDQVAEVVEANTAEKGSPTRPRMLSQPESVLTREVVDDS